MIQLFREISKEYWQHCKKTWKWAFLVSAIFTICWMVVDATQHPVSAVICSK